MSSRVAVPSASQRCRRTVTSVTSVLTQTPLVLGTVTNGPIVVSSALCQIVRVGNVVTLNGAITLSANNFSGANQLDFDMVLPPDLTGSPARSEHTATLLPAPGANFISLQTDVRVLGGPSLQVTVRGCAATAGSLPYDNIVIPYNLSFRTTF